jgi:membrane associated rhomboid family serine protease
MIPLKSLAPRYSFPFVTLALIAANVAVFFYQISLSPSGQEQLVLTYGLVPHNLQLGLSGQIPLLPALIPIFTSMFLHAGWLHIIGNMWFLWVFGADVEDRFGHFTYLGVYFICGIGSALTQTYFTWGSRLPEVGASGAIAGVLGAFMLFFPTTPVLTLIPLFIIWFTARIPAFVFVGIWFAVQFLSGVNSLNTTGHAAANTGGVAWWAHVGGFILGFLLAIPKRIERPAYYRPRP